MSTFNPEDFNCPEIISESLCIEAGSPPVYLLVHEDYSVSKEILWTAKMVNGAYPCLSCELPSVKYEWYEKIINGKLTIVRPLWEILGYHSESDFNQERRDESSTGWVEREALRILPSRWHHLARGL